MKYILMAAVLVINFVGELSWHLSQICLASMKALAAELEEIREMEAAEARMAAQHD